MTNLEISKALALAIGWAEDDLMVSDNTLHACVYELPIVDKRYGWYVFDYMDWNVIAPIAQRYDCFPHKTSAHQWVTTLAIKHDTKPWPFYCADTPQKAIALAVIGAKK